MTLGEIYNKNKDIYNKEASEYIEKFLAKDGDMCHRPFEMLTHHTRMVIERISENSFISFKGYVKDIEYIEGREIKSYKGIKDDLIMCDKNRILRMFGFEISLNPKSKSNKEIELLNNSS